MGLTLKRIFYVKKFFRCFHKMKRRHSVKFLFPFPFFLFLTYDAWNLKLRWMKRKRNPFCDWHVLNLVSDNFLRFQIGYKLLLCLWSLSYAFHCYRYSREKIFNIRFPEKRSRKILWLFRPTNPFHKSSSSSRHGKCQKVSIRAKSRFSASLFIQFGGTENFSPLGHFWLLSWALLDWMLSIRFYVFMKDLKLSISRWFLLYNRNPVFLASAPAKGNNRMPKCLSRFRFKNKLQAHLLPHTNMLSFLR